MNCRRSLAISSLHFRLHPHTMLGKGCLLTAQAIFPACERSRFLTFFGGLLNINIILITFGNRHIVRIEIRISDTVIISWTTASVIVRIIIFAYKSPLCRSIYAFCHLLRNCQRFELLLKIWYDVVLGAIWLRIVLLLKKRLVLDLDVAWHRRCQAFISHRGLELLLKI